jgi:hypothetical protein
MSGRKFGLVLALGILLSGLLSNIQSTLIPIQNSFGRDMITGQSLLDSFNAGMRGEAPPPVKTFDPTKPQSREDCIAGYGMGDPMASAVLCDTPSIMKSYGAKKVTTWDPPGDDSQKMSNICSKQAEGIGEDPVGYCIAIRNNCNTAGLTLDECYAQFFVDPSVVPTDIRKSTSTKYAASIAAMDSAIGSMDQRYGPGSGWAESFGMMGGN